MYCCDKGCNSRLGESLLVVFDCWKMCCIMGDISLAVSFSIFVGILSGPGILLEFRASSCFMTPFSPIARVLIEGMMMGLLLG